MAISTVEYAGLVRAAAAKDPVSAILRQVLDCGAAWCAVQTLSGRLIESARPDSVDPVEPSPLRQAFQALPNPLDQQSRVVVDGQEILAFPIGAEGVWTAMLVVAVDGDCDAEFARLCSTASMLLRLQLGHRRRVVTASRMVRDSVTRLAFAGRLDSAYELAAEMGLSAPPSRPQVACICGLLDWDRDDVLDLIEAALPSDTRQLFAYNDDDECWMLLSASQFQAARPELVGLVERDPALKVLMTEEAPIAKVAHRWQHWAADIRSVAAGTVVDKTVYRGETPSDLVHKLQRDSSPQVLEAVVEYLRCRGRWEAAADSLGIHRNTLRYRVAAAEKLLGVDLADPTPASRLWIALRTAGLTSD